MSNESAVVMTIQRIADPEATGKTDLARELIRLIKGTCIREDCGKYREDALNNCSNAGICIYHEPATLELGSRCGVGKTDCRHYVKIGGFCSAPGAASDRCTYEPRSSVESGPCGLSCINSDCADWGAGSKCQAVSGCLSRVKEPEGACNEPCVNTKCSGSHGALCKSPAACKIQIAPDRPESPEPCNEPCANASCMNQDGESYTCLNYGLCEDCIPVTITDEPCNDPDLLQDYTLDQWEQIKAGGYLCQFTDDGEYPANGPVQRLLGVRTDTMAPFQTDSGGHFLYCRPAELPGVLRPWFGGKCPVHPCDRVVVRFADGGDDTTAAYNLKWGRIGEDGDIVAYMEVK